MDDITVISRKFDRSVQRQWKCRLLERNETLLQLVGTFNLDVEHPALGLIEKGTTSYEYFWLDRWYSIFRFCKPSGAHRNFYCNVSMPPTFDDSILEYIDLDIDLILWPDGRTEILDLDDFKENSKKYSYPSEVCEKALDSLSEIQRMIENKEFPFSDEIL